MSLTRVVSWHRLSKSNCFNSVATGIRISLTSILWTTEIRFSVRVTITLSTAITRGMR